MLLLLKIHKAEYIEDMYEHEYLYFSCLKDFRGKKDDSGRFDPKELNIRNDQLTTLTINDIPFHEVTKKFNAQYMENLSEPKINCCSLYWHETEPNQPPSPFNKRLLTLGERAILIHDYISFFELLDRNLENAGYEYSRKKVTYYDPNTHNGDLTLHHKDEAYSFQNEYRILISPTKNEPVKVKLAGLNKISIVIDTKDIENLRVEITE